MLFRLRYSDHSLEKQRELRCWYFDNGLVSSQLVDPAVVDIGARTITVKKRVPVAGQESQDFPEFVLGEDGSPVTVEQVVDLRVMPLPWMLTKIRGWTRNGSARPTARAFAQSR